MVGKEAVGRWARVRKLPRHLILRKTDSSKGYTALLGRKGKKREGSGGSIWVAQGVGALLFAAGRWQLALAMRRLEVAAAAGTGAGGVLAAGESEPQTQGDLAETGAVLEEAQRARFYEWTPGMWSAVDRDLKWFRLESEDQDATGAGAAAGAATEDEGGTE